MNYFITGATGFIGRFLVAELLKRKDARIYVLVRTGSERKFNRLCIQTGARADQLIAIGGDLTAPGLGIAEADLARLQQVSHFFHLAAIYDLQADAASQQRSNIDGTRNALRAAEATAAGCFHHVSSIAAAGLYPGQFREDMFDEATGLHDPYFVTKHEAEKLVRKESRIPFRIYRPSMVVGHSQTGEMDKADGPYYLFRVMRQLQRWLPRWLPLVGLEGGYFNMVPVDFVARALDRIAHLPALDGQCFHLTAHRNYSLGELMNIVADVAHAPRAAWQISNQWLEQPPGRLVKAATTTGPVRWLAQKALQRLDVPVAMLSFLTYPVTFDTTHTDAALAGTDIQAPDLETYIRPLWDYWNEQLEPAQPRRHFRHHFRTERHD
ncbi:MAG: NAD-dependent epimerase/dehydratase family protein [Gammaproteobacteria bacterium]|nr:NAD-dependent epimerase/dehydratase family protein [Gammaproteobacteria bacterium]